MSHTAVQTTWVSMWTSESKRTGESDLLDLLASHTATESLELHLETGHSGVPSNAWEEALYGPVKDFLGRKGKSFRAKFTRLCWELAGGEGTFPEVLPLIAEIIHAGSLIVDDIEDGAQSRRGAPALHRLYGVPRALNAGNWLYFWALSLLSKAALPMEDEVRLHRLVVLALSRCHHGQALDLSTRVFDWDQAHIAPMVETATRLKSGVLFELAAALGATPAGPDPACAQALVRFGADLGLALQMCDDLSALLNDARIDKAQEDLIQARLTWPWAWIATEADPSTYRAVRSLAAAVYLRDAPFQELRERMRSLLPDRVMSRPRSLLESAFDAVRPNVRSVSALDALHDEINRLEASYV